MRIEKGLATLTQNQESLERIIETKFHDLDLKDIEIQIAVEQLQDKAEERRGRSTTEAFQRVPRAQRSAAVPASDTRATTSAQAPETSSDAFVEGLLSTPSSRTRAPGDRA